MIDYIYIYVSKVGELPCTLRSFSVGLSGYFSECLEPAENPWCPRRYFL